MNKKVWKEVEERSEGLCEFPNCGSSYMVQKHHAYGAANRKRMEMVETIFDLCFYHHQDHKTGVHHNLNTENTIMRMAEENLYAIGWTKEEIIRETALDSKGVGQQYVNWCNKH